MKLRTEPSAFPTPTHNLDNDGMTLRDYFAAQALQGMLSQETIQLQIGKKITMDQVAGSCYEWADKMLEARNYD
jgi:hypothetical protein